jgi:hypothetical protein
MQNLAPWQSLEQRIRFAHLATLGSLSLAPLNYLTLAWYLHGFDKRLRIHGLDLGLM